MAGHDLEIDTPRYVPLEIAMFVCVKPDYFRSDVEAALLEIFSSGTLADGRKGFFQPDFFTFGQTVYLSPLYAAAQAVAGVASVEITRLPAPGLPETSGLTNGFLTMNRLEIARLENDPNFAERGIFTLETRRWTLMATPLNDCGCCEGITAIVPEPLSNRPGLSAGPLSRRNARRLPGQRAGRLVRSAVRRARA